VNPLAEPGDADLSALVDFSALRHAMMQRQQLQHVSSTTTQGDFLRGLEIETRLARLIRDADEKQATELIASYQRLVSSEDMGTTYKVLGFASVAPLAGFS